MRVLRTYWLVVAALWPFFAVAGAAEEAPAVFELDLAEAEVGVEPGGLFVVDGKFVTAESESGKVLEMKAEPLVEGLVLLGDTLRGGGTIRARVEAAKRGRSYPRFGVGMHGISGYHLRVVPARQVVEIVAEDEVIAEAAWAWTGEAATWVAFSVLSAGEGKWKVEGRAWREGEGEPAEALVSMEIEKEHLSGKAVLSGTPYAGLPIRYDRVRVEAEKP